MKKLIYTAIFLQLCISSLLLADPVVFNDPNLELAVEAELGIDDPNEIEMLGLTSLSANSSEIFDLTGLEYATNMNELHLSNNDISDLSPISTLTSLINLYLNNNQIIDISVVSGMASLDTLFLSINLIDDLSPVSGLTGLTSLYLGTNQIINISSLSGLSNLIALDLTNNYVVDISVVPNLTSLEHLYLAHNLVVDIPDMSNLASLQYLHLTDNFIEDIYGLVVGEEPNDLISLLLTENLLNLVSHCTYLRTIEDNNPLISIEVDANPGTCLDHDVCADAIEVFKNDPCSNSSTGATGIDCTNCGEGASELWDYKDVWHFYTPKDSNAVDISLCGSSFDTTLAVYDSCGGTELVCNDQWWCDGSPSDQSLVTMAVTEGETYLIRVAGYAETTGDYTLTITDVNELLVPHNNTCQDADANDIFEIFPYIPVTGSTATAYGTDITSCTLSDSRDVWYYFVPTISGLYMMDPNGSDYNATLAVFLYDCVFFEDCKGTELACNDLYCDKDTHDRCIDGYKSRIIVSLVAEETYFIRISGYAGKVGTYSLEVTLAADIDKNEVVDIIDLSRLLQEWILTDDEGDIIYGISYADIGCAEGEEDGSGGDKRIDLRDFAEIYRLWQVNVNP